MWLLNAKSLKLCNFIDHRSAPPYAILSHTWGDDEVSFEAIQDLEAAEKLAGFRKIKYTCDQASLDGLDYAWVDTCCIDKKSSAELSEAINSMYHIYGASSKCYVYLQDVSGDTPPLKDGTIREAHVRWTASKHVHVRQKAPTRDHLRVFETSRWFTRGWTLQELIAPMTLEFRGEAWNPLGSLNDLLVTVSERTAVDVDILLKAKDVSEASVAKRMSWAAHRTTARVEDRAYSLLGIFGVAMPLLYGEGERAFRRLQELVVSTSIDHTMFAWGLTPGYERHPRRIFAASPDAFSGCAAVEPIDLYRDVGEYAFLRAGRGSGGGGGADALGETTLTDLGVRMTVALAPNAASPPEAREYLVILNCKLGRDVVTLSVHLPDPGDPTYVISAFQGRVALRSPLDLGEPVVREIVLQERPGDDQAPRWLPPWWPRSSWRIKLDVDAGLQVSIAGSAPDHAWNHTTGTLMVGALVGAEEETGTIAAVSLRCGLVRSESAARTVRFSWPDHDYFDFDFDFDFDVVKGAVGVGSVGNLKTLSLVGSAAAIELWQVEGQGPIVVERADALGPVKVFRIGQVHLAKEPSEEPEVPFRGLLKEWR